MALHTQFITHTQIPAQKWNDFIAASPQGGVFALYEYASIVAENWQALIVKEQDKWLAVMPLCLKKKYFLTYSLQPLFSQYWGVFFAAEIHKNTYETYSFYQKILRALLENLPKTHLFVHHFSPNLPYSLPFHWEKFELHTRYTYQIDLQATDNEAIWKNMANPLQRQIKKAMKQAFCFTETQDSPSLYRILAQQPKNVLGTPAKHHATFHQLVQYLLDSGIGKLFQVTNAAGEVLAIALFSVFQQKVVYHIGLQNPAHKENAAMDFLMWKAIEWAKEEQAQTFDFEGSMIENIERFFRKFGALPVPYLQIKKTKFW